MANRYLKLNIEQAYQIKKDMNSSVNNFNNLSQKINAYKQLRKKEIVLKNKLKVSFSSLKSKIYYMQSTLPEEERKNMEYELMQKNRQEKRFNPQVQRFPLVPDVEPTRKITQNNNNNNNNNTNNTNQSSRDISADLEEIRKKLERFR